MSLQIFIKDNSTGMIHEYGSDCHDTLLLSEDGSLHYYNLHTGEGSKFGSYSFCMEDGSDPRDVPDYRCLPFLNIGGTKRKFKKSVTP